MRFAFEKFPVSGFHSLGLLFAVYGDYGKRLLHVTCWCAQAQFSNQASFVVKSIGVRVWCSAGQRMVARIAPCVRLLTRNPEDSRYEIVVAAQKEFSFKVF